MMLLLAGDEEPVMDDAFFKELIESGDELFDIDRAQSAGIVPSSEFPLFVT